MRKVLPAIIAASVLLAGCAETKLVIDYGSPANTSPREDLPKHLQACQDVIGIGDLVPMVTETTAAAAVAYLAAHGAGGLAITAAGASAPAAGPFALVVGVTVFLIEYNSLQREQARMLGQCLRMRGYAALN